MSIVNIQNSDDYTLKVVDAYKLLNKLIASFVKSGDRQYISELESNLIANVLLHSLSVLKKEFDLADVDLYTFANKVHESINSCAINCYLEQPQATLSDLKSAIDLEDLKFNIENGCDY